MILSIAVAFLLAADSPSHTPTVVDTVRYNRDEYGIKLHVPSGWKGRPLLLFPDSKGSIKSASMDQLAPDAYRGRIKSGAEIRYAFWLGPSKYKTGTSGPILDHSGIHESSTPDWFEQDPKDYPEHKPPLWPNLGRVFYAIDTDTFGEGSVDDNGPESVAKHLPYIQGLGINGIWLTGSRNDSDIAINTARDADFKVVAESKTILKGLDGVAAPLPPVTKAWRIIQAMDEAHANINAGEADTAEDRRWAEYVYGFARTDAVKPSVFDAQIRHFHDDYPEAAADQLILRLGGLGRPRPTGAFKGDKARIAQVWMLLFSLPGIPVFDAGDEIGLFDANEKMIWQATRQDSSLSDYVKKLVIARTTRPSLFRGAFTTLLVDDDNHVYAFERDDRLEMTIAIFNNGDDPQTVRIGSAQFGSASFHDLTGNTLLSTFSGALNVHLPGHGCVLLGN